MASRELASRQMLGDETAFGADRHDHGVLDVLRLDQAEDFGAEILRPVGPADAAARHLAEAQMHALDPRRIHEDLVKRPRQRHFVELAAGKLHRNEVPSAAVGAIKIGADRCLDGVDEAAKDAILVEAVDRLQCGFDRGGDVELARRAFIRRHIEMRIEPGMEQGHDLCCDGGVLAQRRPHVILRVGHPNLAQKA